MSNNGMLKYLISFMLLTNSSLAQNYFFDFASWDRLAREQRTLYVLGVIDTVSTLVLDGQGKTAKHYSACIINSKLNGDQLADNVRIYIKTNPKWQNEVMTAGIINYLVALCGHP